MRDKGRYRGGLSFVFLGKVPFSVISLHEYRPQRAGALIHYHAHPIVVMNRAHNQVVIVMPVEALFIPFWRVLDRLNLLFVAQSRAQACDHLALVPIAEL